MMKKRGPLRREASAARKKVSSIAASTFKDVPNAPSEMWRTTQLAPLVSTTMSEQLFLAPCAGKFWMDGILTAIATNAGGGATSYCFAIVYIPAGQSVPFITFATNNPIFGASAPDSWCLWTRAVDAPANFVGVLDHFDRNCKVEPISLNTGDSIYLSANFAALNIGFSRLRSHMFFQS